MTFNPGKNTLVSQNSRMCMEQCRLGTYNLKCHVIKNKFISLKLSQNVDYKNRNHIWNWACFCGEIKQ